MTYTAATPYRTIGDTTLAAYEAEFRRVDSPMLANVAAVYAAAIPHSALFLAMAKHEQMYATTSVSIPARFCNPVGLKQWYRNGAMDTPPGCTGLTPNGIYLAFDSWANAVREWRRRLFDDPAYKGGVYARTTTLQEMIDTYAPPGDVHEVTGIDNADSGYVMDVLALLTRMEAAGLLPAGVEASPMALKPYRFVGLDRDVWLPDDITVIIDIVPASRKNIRSNTESTSQEYSVYHQTGNYAAGANAIAERNWLHSGAGGAYVGYNFAVDDKRIIQLTPLDEVTWHGGRTWWNANSWGIEQCVGSTVNQAQARRNAAALHGGLCAAKDWDPDKAVVQHYVVYKKNCPELIRSNGLWPSVQTATRESAATARAAAGGAGGGAPAQPVYAAAVPIPELDAISKGDIIAPSVVIASGTVWFWVGDTVEAVKTTPRYQYADPASAHIGPDIAKGSRFDVDWVCTFNDEQWFYTPWGTRVRAVDTARVSDQKGAAAA